MLIGSAILAAAWLAQSEFHAPDHVGAAALSGTATAGGSSRHTCASLAPGMTAAEVKSRMGEADEVRADEETRGPGASMLIYRGSRCAVHLLDDQVEFVD